MCRGDILIKEHISEVQERESTNITGKSSLIDHRWPIRIAGVWIAMLLLIQIFSFNTQTMSMPDSCPDDSMNCVRIAHDGTSYRSEGLEAPLINSSQHEVRTAIHRWLVDVQGGDVHLSTYYEDQAGFFMHGVDRTDFLFFPDDLYVFTECTSDNITALTLQSKSRLGVGDIGVNHARLSALINHLSSIQWSGDLCE